MNPLYRESFPSSHPGSIRFPPFLPPTLNPSKKFRQLFVWRKREPPQMIRRHYPDQYPLGRRTEVGASCEEVPASVGRTHVHLHVGILNQTTTGACQSAANQRAGLSPWLVTMATNGRGGNCRWMEHKGRAGSGEEWGGECSHGCYVLGITWEAGWG